MGFYNALQACFTLHQLNHSHWAEVHDNKTGRGAARGRDGLAQRPAGRTGRQRPGARPTPARS